MPAPPRSIPPLLPRRPSSSAREPRSARFLRLAGHLIPSNRPILAKEKPQDTLALGSSLTARRLPSHWLEGKDRIKSLPPCFQKYISRNPAWKGEKRTATNLHLSAQKRKYLPNRGNRTSLCFSQNEEIVPTPFPPRAWKAQETLSGRGGPRGDSELRRHRRAVHFPQITTAFLTCRKLGSLSDQVF